MLCFSAVWHSAVFSRNLCVAWWQTALCCGQFLTWEICLLPKLIRALVDGEVGAACLFLLLGARKASKVVSVFSCIRVDVRTQRYWAQKIPAKTPVYNCVGESTLFQRAGCESNRCAHRLWGRSQGCSFKRGRRAQRLRQKLIRVGKSRG